MNVPSHDFNAQIYFRIVQNLVGRRQISVRKFPEFSAGIPQSITYITRDFSAVLLKNQVKTRIITVACIGIIFGTIIFGKQIYELKKKKNAIILTHCYQSIEIDEVADFVGDSFYLSKIAQKTNADIIVFSGVF